MTAAKDTALPAATALLYSPWSGKTILNEALCKVRLLQSRVGNPSWLREIAWGQNMQNLKAFLRCSFTPHLFLC